jgi:hypothetical protein
MSSATRYKATEETTGGGTRLLKPRDEFGPLLG